MPDVLLEINKEEQQRFPVLSLPSETETQGKEATDGPPVLSSEDIVDDSHLEQIEKEKKIKEKNIAEKNKLKLIFTVIGYFATVFSIAVYIPLVVEVYINPSAACHINPWQYWLAVLANLLWVVYAAALKAWPLLATSVAVVIMIGLILIQKYITQACQEEQQQQQQASASGTPVVSTSTSDPFVV